MKAMTFAAHACLASICVAIVDASPMLTRSSSHNVERYHHLPYSLFAQFGTEPERHALVVGDVFAGDITLVTVNETRVEGKANGMLEVGSTGHKRVSPHSWFAVTFSFAFIVKAMCMSSNVVFQVSPVFQIRQFEKQKDTGAADAAPFMCILYGGCQWCFYGLFAFLVTHKSGFLVLVYSNVLGAFLGFYYVFGFQRNCQDKATLRKLTTYQTIAAMLVSIQAVAMLTMHAEKSLFFCGLVSSLCSVVSSSSLLATLPEILRTRCSASINVPLLAVGLASSCMWIVCGVILWDYWIMVPNTIGCFIQSVTFGLVWVFPRDPCKAVVSEYSDVEEDDLPEPPEVENMNVDELRANSWAIAQWHRARAAASSMRASRSKYGATQVMGETGGTF